MRILLTGVAGFIGSRVAEVLLDEGHELCGIDNLCPAYDVQLKHHRLARFEGKAGLEFRRLDITDRDDVVDMWRESGPFDAVINLAARAGVRQSVEDPWVYVDTNIDGTLNLLELCRREGVGKFILASTSSLYGANNPVPFSEDAPTDQPLSPYAASKKGAEAMCWTYHHLYGLDVTVFRYFTVYGPAGRPDMSLFRFTQWIHEGLPLRLYGDGTQSRDFTYVDDIARGTTLGLKGLGHETINLGSDHPHDLLEVIRLIEEQAGRKAKIEHHPMHAADVMATWANIGKAERLLGWRPQVTLEEGIARLCSWYRENREWAKTVETTD
ncbi:MAG TPA: NAD-dependent epimerase/dehydratase family protein [Thermoleophilia bacterium]|nr:NAD-dependent epimerase/dehydratase family protein [Thermoleophilia bacterium]